MKQRLLCLAALCVPLLSICQQVSTLNMPTKNWIDSTYGIKWTEGLSWQQIQQKAKKENKYIFVDCYATWCKPCKQMDREVYTVDSVSDYLNERFISVKLQMDVTKYDNEAVKSWRKTATEIERIYRISAYPSYVFFAPNGEVVSKAIGYKEPNAFIQVARDATDPSKQYFVLLKKYREGKLDDASTISLIKMVQQIGDTAEYHQLLKSYYAFLHKQKKEKLYTKENIVFVASTLDRSSMVLFDMFYPDGKEVNKIMQTAWYSKRVVDNIINTEKVQPFLNNMQGKTEPEWKVLYSLIAKDYNNEYAARNILQAKVEWYSSQGNVLKFASSLSDKLEKYGSDTTNRGDEFKLNTAAFVIWENLGKSTELSEEEVTELTRVSNWMAGVVRRGATATGFRLEQWHLYIDTYANLLHKIGRTDEAIKWQEFAILKCKEIGGAWTGALDAYVDRLDKMKKGLPTWPIKEN
jgi:thioredoxin-related protein